ncbi:MAG: galactose mutarotase [Holophagales bacterium]|nr:galactose mutarotase [Holophagales bacterium]MYF96024.1 galactose mutarotase [Holophagales bacterium]
MRSFVLLVLVAALTAGGCFLDPGLFVEVTRQPWGEVDGKEVELFRLESRSGTVVEIAELGGAIVSLTAADRDGEFADVVLGFNDLDSYLADTNPYFGAIVGRYANRIAGGEFTLDGKTYNLPRNDGENSLHGGVRGLTRVVWDGEPIRTEDGRGVALRYRSPDGEEGYPGNVDFEVRYILGFNDLRIEAEATTDKPTVVNLSFHSYFNLKGEGEGDILDHELALLSLSYTPVDASLIPTGEIASVLGTPMRFVPPMRVGERIDDDFEQLRLAGGYDHNWVVDRSGASASEQVSVARLYEPASGRELQVTSSAPGLQLYTGNFLDGTLVGKSGRPYVHRGGVCLETQHFPDSPNQPGFPSTVLRPGETYRQVTEYLFYTDSVGRRDR